MNARSWKWVRRMAWGVFGAAYFLWLGVEDRSALLVFALGALLSAGLYLEGWSRWVRGGRGRSRLLRAAALGLALGASVAPFAAVLMLMKVSLHSHAQPDFSGEQVLGALARTPAWAAAGLLLGTALGVLTSGAAQGNDAHVAPPQAVEYNGQTDEGPPAERHHPHGDD